MPPHAAFTRLEAELKPFTDSPVGVGLDAPHWLRRLEQEVGRVQATQTTVVMLAENAFHLPKRPVSWDELQRQLADWNKPLGAEGG